MEDETASAGMVGMDGTESMPVKSVDDAMNEPQKVSQNNDKFCDFCDQKERPEI